jgi:hypothetical protein
LKGKIMSLVWTIIVLALIYGAIGVGAEFINDKKEGNQFGFDKKSLTRILKWPKHLLSNKDKE